MISYNFSENVSELNSKQYHEVYEKQNLIHQDYFHHPEFQYACISVFKNYSKCYLLSVYKNDKLIGYATFRTINLGFRKITYEFLVPVVFRVSKYNYPIIDKNYIHEFLNTLSEALDNFNIYYQHVPGFFKKNILDNVKNSFVNGVIDNPILRNFEGEILKASKKKTPCKRKRQLIRDYDHVEIKHISSGVSEELLSSFFELHIKRWRKDGVTSKFSLKEYRDIYFKISNLKIENVGFPMLSYLKVDGELMAMQYGYIFNKIYLANIIAMKTNNSPRSSGTILIKEVLNYISSEEIEIYDMGVGLEAYKKNYMNDVDTYFNIAKFKSSFSGFINRISLK